MEKKLIEIKKGICDCCGFEDTIYCFEFNNDHLCKDCFKSASKKLYDLRGKKDERED